MNQRVYHNSGSENSSHSNRSEACHHDSQGHSDPRAHLLSDMASKSYHEFCHTLPSHFRRSCFHIEIGSCHREDASETAQEMGGLERWTFAQSTLEQIKNDM